MSVIDLGQAVDTSHPKAHDFLRADAANITTYFARQGAGELLLSPEALVQLVCEQGAVSAHPSIDGEGERTGSDRGHAPAAGSGASTGGLRTEAGLSRDTSGSSGIATSSELLGPMGQTSSSSSLIDNSRLSVAEVKLREKLRGAVSSVMQSWGRREAAVS